MLICRNNDFKDAKVTLLHGMRVTIPTIYFMLVRPSHPYFGGRRGGEARTEVSDQKGLLGIWSPFSIDNIVVFVDIEAENINPLWINSQKACESPRRWSIPTFENLSKPPSVSSMV